MYNEFLDLWRAMEEHNLGVGIHLSLSEKTQRLRYPTIQQVNDYYRIK